MRKEKNETGINKIRFDVVKMKPILFIMCGEAFSGKSTISKHISKKYGAQIIGRDSIYFSLEKHLALEGTPEEDDDMLWDSLWSVAVQGAKNQLLLGSSVVFDDVCLQKVRRDELKKVAEQSKAKYILIFLNISKEGLKRRKEENKKTKTRHDVPSAWMEADREDFERPTPDENPITVTDTSDKNHILDLITKAV